MLGTFPTQEFTSRYFLSLTACMSEVFLAILCQSLRLVLTTHLQDWQTNRQAKLVSSSKCFKIASPISFWRNASSQFRMVIFDWSETKELHSCTHESALIFYTAFHWPMWPHVTLFFPVIQCIIRTKFKINGHIFCAQAALREWGIPNVCMENSFLLQQWRIFVCIGVGRGE